MASGPECVSLNVPQAYKSSPKAAHRFSALRQIKAHRNPGLLLNHVSARFYFELCEQS